MAAKNFGRGKKLPPKKAEHGPEAVLYANDGFGYKPHIVCLCGWRTEVGSFCSWSEAGDAFDQHLAGVKSG